MVDKVDVFVPPADWRMGNKERVLWQATGLVFEGGKISVGFDMAISIMLSRLSTELRREKGLDMAMEAFRKIAETMPVAATMDVKDV